MLFARQARATDVYLSAGGSGAKTGTTWNNAKDFNTYFNTYFTSGTASIPAGTHIYIKEGNYNVGNPAFPAQLNSNDILIQGGFASAATGIDKSSYNPLIHITKISGSSFVGNNGALSSSTNAIEIKGIEYAGSGNFFFGNVGSQGMRGTLKFTDLNIHNSSGATGGAVVIQANGTGSSASFTNCVFANNSNSAAGGGAITDFATNTPMTFTSCSFTGNTQSGGANGGGAILSQSNLTISNSYFCNNTGLIGGAIGIASVGAVYPLYTVSNTTFSNNTASLYGGAIGMASGNIAITSCNFYGNTTANGRGGGGICVVTSNAGTPNTVANSVFYNNGCTSPINPYGGGAISMMPGSAANYQITNTKFVNNYVTGGYGGAICYDNNGSTLAPTLSGCLFYGNTINGSATAANSDLAIRYGFSPSDPDFVVNSSKLQLAQSAYVGYGGGTQAYTFGTGANVNTFSNTTDNGGVGTPTFTCPTLINAVAVDIQGQVWDDVNGNVALDGSENGTDAGGTLYVNLVNGSGTVVGSALVSSTGSYTLSGAPTNVTGYKLVLTNSATSSTPGPLPSQWVNTGEIAGSGNSASQSATLGQIELNTGTTTISGANFGIEHLPTPGSGTASVSNSGGSSPVTVPPSAFTSTSAANDNGDTPPGSVTAIHITTFPSNVTSLTINGTVYTSIPSGGITVPTNGSGAPTVPILIDPTNDTQPVVFTYTAIDNAGKESITTGTATINSSLLVSVSGHVFDDANGLNDTPTGIVSGTAINGPSLPVYISLVQAGVAVATVPVQTDGTYSLTGVSPGSYSLVITTNPAGSATASLPSAWTAVGENLGAGAGNDSDANGVLPVTISANTTEANFGIDQLPSASPVSQTYVNPGGTSEVQVPTLAGTDPEDGALGAGNTFVIHSVPSSGILYYSGVAITAADVAGPGLVISDYIPSELTYDPIDGPGSYSFAYSSVDAAGIASLTTATATMIFTVPVPDLSPVIYARPSTISGTKPITVVVEVYELNGAPTSGLITVKLSKDPKVSLSFTNTATSVGGQSVSNSAWNFDDVSDDDYYVLTTNQVIAAGDLLPFGLSGTLTPGATSGTLTFTTVIGPGSGGEVLITNNTDADKIDFFQQ